MQVMRVATFEKKPVVDPVKYDEFRTWMASQPGLLALYHVSDPHGGRYLSISVWESREAVLAMKDRVFPGGPLSIKPDSVAIYEVEASGGPRVLRRPSERETVSMSPAITDGRVAVVLTSEDDRFADISQSLPNRDARLYRRGSPRGKTGKFHEANMWSVRRAFPAVLDLDRAFAGIVDDIRPAIDSLRASEVAWSGTFGMSAWSDARGVEIRLPAALIALAAELGCGFDFDLYCGASDDAEPGESVRRASGARLRGDDGDVIDSLATLADGRLAELHSREGWTAMPDPMTSCASFEQAFASFLENASPGTAPWLFLWCSYGSPYAPVTAEHVAILASRRQSLRLTFGCNWQPPT